MTARSPKLLCTLMLGAICACAPMPQAPLEDAGLSAVTSRTLKRFSDEQEFRRYIASVHDIAVRHDLWWAYERRSPDLALLAQNDPIHDCNPTDEDCNLFEEMVVTASTRASSSAQSITNNQETGVDEGDIVKRYKNFLVVLQHGRLFSIDMGRDASALRLVDRINVYTSANRRTWYDELLISDNKLVVTGFDYSDDTTEISVFEISDTGIFTLLTTYAITSQDYYSDSNYATRMVDGRLVIYTPLYLADYDVDEGVVFPMYRQTMPDGQETFWQPLFSATDLFWPVQETLVPVVHTISVCPITGDDGLTCRSTGIVGPAYREFYVSESDVYIWNAQDPDELWELDDEDWDYCAGELDSDNYDPLNAALYRIPLFGGETTAVKAAGVPLDQFSLDARTSGFHALLAWTPNNCWTDDYQPMKYLYVGATEFARTPRTLEPERYASVPAARGYYPQNRFNEDFLTYTDTIDYGSAGRPQEFSDIVVVPLAQPSRPSRVPLGFAAERLEIFADGLVATGTLSRDGLHLSTITLGDAPRVADREFIPGYFESEGRSHAFNLQVDDDGLGIFGIPVTTEVPYRSWTVMRDNSDIAFFSVVENMRMTSAGMLTSTPVPDDSDYVCEVSCYDWYGNARPIFIGDRIFALSGSELIEGAMINGRIAETARLTLTSTPDYSR